MRTRKDFAWCNECHVEMIPKREARGFRCPNCGASSDPEAQVNVTGITTENLVAIDEEGYGGGCLGDDV